MGLSGCEGDDSNAAPTFVPKILYSFGSGSTDAAGPDQIMQASDGNFYGATSTGGASGLGAVFKITPAGVETVLHSFTGAPADGASPQNSRLIQGSDGNLYGTTLNGGASDLGTVFMISPDGAETILYSFTGGVADGANPSGGLLQYSDGNFYGTTDTGGANNSGTAFKLTPAGVETVIYSFVALVKGSDIIPAYALIEGSDGNLYGISADGGSLDSGTVFSLSTEGVETVLHTFGNGDDGEQPNADLTLGSDGNLYGTTPFGGSNATLPSDGGMGGGSSPGTVFKVTPDGVETVIHSFSISPDDGSFPLAGVFQGSDGNLYGTTAFGGAKSLGTVFRLTPAGVETVLHSFTGGAGDGDGPGGNLIEGSDGNLYGTTGGGGANGNGTFFRIVLN
jgi:uncharacterized repeat protein (TIGR03803 family)